MSHLAPEICCHSIKLSGLIFLQQGGFPYHQHLKDQRCRHHLATGAVAWWPFGPQLSFGCAWTRGRSSGSWRQKAKSKFSRAPTSTSVGAGVEAPGNRPCNPELFMEVFHAQLDSEDWLLSRERSPLLLKGKWRNASLCKLRAFCNLWMWWGLITVLYV